MDEHNRSDGSVSGAMVFALYVFVSVAIFAIGYVIVRKFY